MLTSGKSIQAQILPRIKQLIIEKYDENLIGLVLYGSVARGTEHNQSDIDLLLVLDRVPKNRYERTDFFIGEIEEPIQKEMLVPQNVIPIELNPNIKSWEELTTGSFLNFTIAEEGIILFEREKLLSDYFTKLRIRFQEMGVKKIRFKGGYYYDFLPKAKTLEVFEL